MNIFITYIIIIEERGLACRQDVSVNTQRRARECLCVLERSCGPNAKEGIHKESGLSGVSDL